MASNTERNLNDNAAKAWKSEAKIVITSRDLDLSPAPGGFTPIHWQGKCLETIISTSTLQPTHLVSVGVGVRVAPRSCGCFF